MEKANNEKIKEIFLTAFVLLCVGLILGIWANAFVQKDVETPYFYREVPDFSETFNLTETALAVPYPPQAGTPTPVSTRSQPSTMPSPTATPDLLLNFTPESDN